jgi:hypothetical protein
MKCLAPLHSVPPEHFLCPLRKSGTVNVRSGLRLNFRRGTLPPLHQFTNSFSWLGGPHHHRDDDIRIVRELLPPTPSLDGDKQLFGEKQQVVLGAKPDLRSKRYKEWGCGDAGRLKASRRFHRIMRKFQPKGLRK